VFGLSTSLADQKMKVGATCSNCGIVAFSFRMVVSFVWSSVFTAILFVCTPERSPILKVAVISPLSLGPTSSFASAAVVHPQEGCTEVIFTGLSPVFLYLKCATAVLSAKPGCKSTSVVSQVSAACAGTTIAKTRASKADEGGIFIIWGWKNKPKSRFSPMESAHIDPPLLGGANYLARK